MSKIFLIKDQLKDHQRCIRESKRFYFKAQDALRSGKWIKAIQYLQKSLEIKDDYHPAWRDLADIYHQHGDVQQAQKYIQKALEIKPDDPVSLFIQGVIHLTDRDIQSALFAFNRALENGELNWGLAYNLGLCYYGLQKIDISIEYLNKAIQKDPSQLQPYLLLAQALIIQKKTDIARDVLIRAKRMRPHDPHLNVLLANILDPKNSSGD